MEHERFELQNAPNTVEMAASSSKMLQIAENLPNQSRNPKDFGPFCFSDTECFEANAEGRIYGDDPRGLPGGKTTIRFAIESPNNKL